MKKFLIFALLITSSIAVFAASEGIGFGYKDEIKVSVEKDGDKIISIKVLEMKDTKRIAEPAIEKLTSEIIAKQSVDVDDVAGATYTSQGFKEAVADALKK
ncbi:FMN-binding protein [Fusobacterium varium]|jgi:uncharacterized protein with FMN-binding domain|uniref:FMN-binding protein n=1 Tax=Fusobacterium varium ATCC 27725 TaxID=469618 RepID=A0ABN5JH65_FUSVA|nr:FMN-binding protein [Fusobacterium varium]AVQ30129.1 FMN-binding protein [Fusobacterium varium ATCC 27725]EES64847.1 FMN-binding domain protein [Fusobacterium varium ATCC 27725]MDY4007157.1 FMN-binding protein [Fusobacterium varium]VEH37951.1 Predicted NADH:ubiquinone oxidoreductase, subunit RnfG [Fusobacterium varium]